MREVGAGAEAETLEEGVVHTEHLLYYGSTLSITTWITFPFVPKSPDKIELTPSLETQNQNEFYTS